VKAEREPDRVQERAKLLAEIVRELQHQLEDAIDALGLELSSYRRTSTLQ
jgi:hypothetical protein